MKKLLPLLLLFVLPISASPLPDYPFVYVNETATKEIAPDLATLHFEIATRDKLAEVAFEQQAKTSKAIIAFATSLKIDGKDIISRPLEKSSEHQRYREIRESKEPQYDISRDVTITMKDLAAYPQLLEFLYKQEYVVEIHASFSRADEEKIRADLLKEACAQALKKAGTLAEGFSRKVKGVKAISEQGFEDFVGDFGLSANSSGSFAASVLGGGEQDFRTIPETVTFRRTVFAICELE